jgi:hypothetical protein
MAIKRTDLSKYELIEQIARGLLIFRYMGGKSEMGSTFDEISVVCSSPIIGFNLDDLHAMKWFKTNMLNAEEIESGFVEEWKHFV